MQRVRHQGACNRVIRIVADELKMAPNRIKKDAGIQDDLGADSLDLMQIAIGIEEAFNVEIDERTMAECDTVNRMADMLVGRAC